MSWGTVIKLLVLAIGLRVVWGWAIDEDKADDPPMAVPTADWDEWQAERDRYMQRLWEKP